MDTFWLFLLIILSSLPTTMIIFGSTYMKFAPGYGYMFGYKTKRSLKNRYCWEFAHLFFGRVWFITGIILLVINLVVMLFAMPKDHELIGMLALAVAGAELIGFVISILITESALKKNFDDDGNMR